MEKHEKKDPLESISPIKDSNPYSAPAEPEANTPSLLNNVLGFFMTTGSATPQ